MSYSPFLCCFCNFFTDLICWIFGRLKIFLFAKIRHIVFVKKLRKGDLNYE